MIVFFEYESVTDNLVKINAYLVLNKIYSNKIDEELKNGI